MYSDVRRATLAISSSLERNHGEPTRPERGRPTRVGVDSNIRIRLQVIF